VTYVPLDVSQEDLIGKYAFQFIHVHLRVPLFKDVVDDF